MKIIIIIISFIALSASNSGNENYSKWKLQQGKKSFDENSQANQEKIFMENSQIIEQYNKAQSDFELGYNEYSNVDPDEFIEHYCGTSLPDKLQSDRPMLKRAKTINNYTIEDLPESIDYSKYVQVVKDQGTVCGSCWAFSIMSLLESLNNMKNSAWKENLAPQYLIDCNHKNGRCQGGWPTVGLNFIKINSQNQAPKSDDYKYTGKNGTCRSYVSKIPVNINNIFEYKINSNEDDLRLKLANHGPLVIAMFVNKKPPLFQNYRKGIFYDDNCPKQDDKDFKLCRKINHSMLLVGYGVEDNKPYFKVLNSWGEKWGEKGFVRMARNRGNNCNIACYAMGADLFTQ